MERGDAGLGRDAYGLPGREHGRRGYGPGPYPSDDGYPASPGYEDDDAAGSGRPADVEDDDYGQLLRRPGEVPPRQQRLRQPGRPHGAPPNGAHPDGGAPGTAPGRQYRLPNGRRVPPGADPMYRSPGPSMPGGTSGRHHGPGPAGNDPYASGRIGPPSPPGGAIPGVPGPVPAHGGPQPYGRPAAPGPAGGPLREHQPGGPRFDAPDGRERLGPDTHGPLGHPGPAGPPGPSGPVIRQREAAVPDDRAGGTAQPVASIASDGLEAFARDLRALRAKAGLDYPAMAEVSHYEMKTLAAAAGGLRLPTLPVAVAFVRACGGNITEWEERWQKIAEKITADAAKKRRADGEPPEPADAVLALEPPVRKPAAAPPPDQDGGDVYVITSARPRQPGR